MTEEQKEKRKAYDKARYATPERKAYNKIYAAKPETRTRAKAYMKIYNATPESIIKSRNYRYGKNFDLTLEQYNEMLTAQGGKCATCKRPQSEFKRNFAVDHNHTTGKVRGLLCIQCNLHVTGFDNMKNYFIDKNISITKTFIEYLNN